MLKTISAAALAIVLGASAALAQNQTFTNMVTNAPTATTPFGSSALIPVIQDGVTKKFTIQSITVGMFTDASNAVLPTARTNFGLDKTANAFLTGGGAGAAYNAVPLTGLVLGNGASAPTAYAGTSCTNQFARALSAAGAATCASVANADLTNPTLTLGSTILTLGATTTTVAGLTLTAPALGTPSAIVLTNGTGLPISTGVSGLGSGVATFLATPSSANLAAAVTGETGSGALVFDTSPTLVTPALGTPSALVLTNATGLPISTGVSGLGAGVATFLATPSSANLATAVTGETGSGALVFATSPALVTPDIGTPSAATLTNATGLPVSTGISGLGTGIASFLATPGAGVATFLSTPSSANLATAVTGETGTGALVFGTGPSISAPIVSGHPSVSGSAPAPTSCGAGPATIGTDFAGQVTMGTGTPTGCVLTFNAAFVSAPFCTVTWKVNIASMQYAVSNTAITLTQTATDSNVVNWHCVAQAGG